MFYLKGERFGSEVTPLPPELAPVFESRFFFGAGLRFSFPFSKLFSFYTDIQRFIRKPV